MKSAFFEDFNERSKEVSKYFLFLKNLEQERFKLYIDGCKGKTKIRKIDSDLEKTLKASGFLLLYNLIESTMRNAIEAIFDEISTQKVSFNDIKPGIKKIILENIKDLKVDEKIILQITDISLYIINAGFNKEKVFSGNIDSKKITNVAKTYGFSCESDYAKTGHGHDLAIIKNNRNDLAHGVKSFSIVGREKSADELLKIKNKVIRYLRQILINIDNYLTNKEYLDSSK